MLLKDLLELVVTIRFKSVDQLLDRHQLDRAHLGDAPLVFCLAELAALSTLVEEAIKGQRLGVGTDESHGTLRLLRFIASLPLMRVLHAFIFRRGSSQTFQLLLLECVWVTIGSRGALSRLVE